MGRRRSNNTSSGAADGLMDLVARLPWWAGVGLALVSYWMLHAVATRPMPVAKTAQQIGDAVPAMMWQSFALFGQYLLPFICLMGAIASALGRRKRQGLFDSAASADSVAALQGISWQEFELLVGEGFKRRGYRVQELGGGGPDGGVDLVLTRAGGKSFVQCKQWKAFKVGVPTVRELYGVMAAHGATGGFVVTSGRFTQEAQAFADGRNIQLIDGAELMRLLREARGQEEARPPAAKPAFVVRSAPETSERAETVAAKPPPAVMPDAEPACPRCGKPMVRRVAKRGRMRVRHSGDARIIPAGVGGLERFKWPLEVVI